MYLESIMLSEINQTEKHKYQMLSLRCGIQKNKVNKETKQNENRLIDTENNQMVARRKGVVGCAK